MRPEYRLLRRLDPDGIRSEVGWMPRKGSLRRPGSYSAVIQRLTRKRLDYPRGENEPSSEENLSELQDSNIRLIREERDRQFILIHSNNHHDAGCLNSAVNGAADISLTPTEAFIDLTIALLIYYSLLSPSRASS